MYMYMQLIFISPLFQIHQHTLTYPKTIEKQELNEIKNKLQHIRPLLSISCPVFSSVVVRKCLRRKNINRGSECFLESYKSYIRS